jgi:hypothetical protein
LRREGEALATKRNAAPALCTQSDTNYVSDAGQLFEVHCGNVKPGTKKAVFSLWIPHWDFCWGINKMAFVILGAVIGASCALLRRRLLLILALSALLALVATLGGTILHADRWMIAAMVFGSVAALQLTYVAVGLMLHLVRFRKLIPPIQTAIGRRLRAELEVPRSLPPELSALVARLRAA